MRMAATLGLPVAVHAENDAITAALAARAVAAGRTSARDYLASRPAIAESEAIGRAICFAQEAGCALHVVHVSTGRGAALIAEARARGVDVSAETCPHYLLFTEDDLARLGTIAKCAPPLRPQSDRDALWRSLMAGEIAIVASDHSPAPAAMKARDDFFAAWGGISGCQSLLAALLSAGCHARGLAPATVASVTATGPARRLRLARKGRIAPGYDADLVLVDLAARVTLRREQLRYRHRLSPYLGMAFVGKPERTLLRGETAAIDGRPTGATRGRLARPSPWA
jgi:allantoinase